MFSSIRNFLSRHKRKFIVSGIVIGGVYLVTNYAQKKLKEWQEREAKKFFEMTRKKQHFESTERTCNQTILTLSKIVSDNIMTHLDMEDILLKLQDQPQNKHDLWEEMKILIFARICVVVYSLNILQVMLRVQLNIIGGYLFRDSVQEGEHMIDSELQAKYLSMYHHFISDGIEELVVQITSVVKQVVEPIPLKKKVTLQEVEQIFWSVQTKLCTNTSDGDPVKKMVHYLVGHVHVSEGKLDTLVKETMDVLESDEVISLTTSCISHSFSNIVDEIANIFAFKSPTTKSELEMPIQNGSNNHHSMTFVDVNKVELHFVKLLPMIHNLITKKMCKGSNTISELLTHQLTLNDKMKVFSANIYEVFSSS